MCFTPSPFPYFHHQIHISQASSHVMCSIITDYSQIPVVDLNHAGGQALLTNEFDPIWILQTFWLFAVVVCGHPWLKAKASRRQYMHHINQGQGGAGRIYQWSWMCICGARLGIYQLWEGFICWVYISVVELWPKTFQLKWIRKIVTIKYGHKCQSKRFF